MAKSGSRIYPVRAQTVKAAHNANAVFELLKSGKTSRQVSKELGLSQQIVRSHIRALRAGLKRVPQFLPAKGTLNWSLKKANACASLMKNAKEILEGRAMPPKRKTRGTGISEGTRKAIALFKSNPSLTSTEIARRCGVSVTAVLKQRTILVAAGEIQKQDIGLLMKRVHRHQSRITGYFKDPAERARIISQRRSTIDGYAKSFYLKNSAVFDEIGILPEQFADKVAEMLDWKLQTFDPKRMKCAESEKLQRYLSWHMRRLSLDSLRNARKKYHRRRKTRSLSEAGYVTDAGRELPLEALLAAKPTDRFEGVDVSQLEKISARLKLNPYYEATLFGLAAGIPQNQIGKRLGVDETRICQIRKDLKQRVKNLVSG